MDSQGQQQKVKSNVLMCIDILSNLVKFIRIANETSHHIRDKFVQCCLSLPIHIPLYTQQGW